jgi:RNA polymerase sigma factor (sigma-70 family)
MEAVGTHAPPAAGGHGRSRRLLGLASDELLVRRVRGGSEAAFATLYERHYRKLLSFCRHMLGSAEEAEDAVQQTFFNAHQDMLRDEKELHVRPWLYRIARNLCISALRARRYDLELGETEPSLVGLSEQVANRRELRDLLRDLAGLPVEQREALVLAELHGNSHAEVAEIIGCDREKVKSLVFQARSSLIKSREAREVSCEEIRRQLSVLRGGSLRRGVIRRHLRECEGCRRFGQEVKRQRHALALVLPVIPSATLKLGAASAAAAVGIKGAAAGGSAVAGGAVAGGGGAAAGTAVAGGGAAGGALSGSLAAVAGKLGMPLLVVKGAAATAAVTIVAAGGTVGVKATHEIVADDPPALESTSDGRDASGVGRGEGPGANSVGAGALAEGKRAPGRGERRRRAARGPRRSRVGARRDRATRGASGLAEGGARRVHPDGQRRERARTGSPPGRSNPGRLGRERVSPDRSRSRRSAGRRNGTPAVQRRRRSARRVPRRPARRQETPLAREGEVRPPVQGDEIPLTRGGDMPLPQR